MVLRISCALLGINGDVNFRHKNSSSACSSVLFFFSSPPNFLILNPDRGYSPRTNGYLKPPSAVLKELIGDRVFCVFKKFVGKQKKGNRLNQICFFDIWKNPRDLRCCNPFSSPRSPSPRTRQLIQSQPIRPPLSSVTSAPIYCHIALFCFFKTASCLKKKNICIIIMNSVLFPTQFNGQQRRNGRRRYNNSNRRQRPYPAHKQRLPIKDADGNVAMGGMDEAGPSSFPWGRQNQAPYRGGHRGGFRQRRNRHQNTVQNGPRNGTKAHHRNFTPAPELSFWEKVNWEPKDIPMEDAAAPPEWSQYSYANTNGLQTRIDIEGDIVMGDAPSLTMALLTELVDVLSIKHF